jgi:hypothetical protein
MRYESAADPTSADPIAALPRRADAISSDRERVTARCTGSSSGYRDKISCQPLLHRHHFSLRTRGEVQEGEQVEFSG